MNPRMKFAFALTGVCAALSLGASLLLWWPEALSAEVPPGRGRRGRGPRGRARGPGGSRRDRREARVARARADPGGPGGGDRDLRSHHLGPDPEPAGVKILEPQMNADKRG